MSKMATFSVSGYFFVKKFMLKINSANRTIGFNNVAMFSVLTIFV